MGLSDNVGAYRNQPVNINFLIPHRFRLTIKRTPNVVYYCQEVAIPEITKGSAIQATPFIDVPIYSDKIMFGDLNITFSVDENLQNYREIQRWMRGLGFPETFEQFQGLSRFDVNGNPYRGVYSDIVLTILDNSENPLTYVYFQDCFPISIGAVQFDTKMTDAQATPCTATFKYSLYVFHDPDETSEEKLFGA